MAALAIVGALLIAIASSYTSELRSTSEAEQLRNILSQVAAEGSQLLTLITNGNSSARVFVQLPAALGSSQYWLRIRNDSAYAWIEGALGQEVNASVPNKFFLPKGISAEGDFVGGYGPALLEAYMNGSALQLKLGYLGD